jgi:hypothetical protein
MPPKRKRKLGKDDESAVVKKEDKSMAKYEKERMAKVRGRLLEWNSIDDLVVLGHFSRDVDIAKNKIGFAERRLSLAKNEKDSWAIPPDKREILDIAQELKSQCETVIEKFEEQLFYVSAKFGSKDRYASVVAWKQSSATADLEKLAENLNICDGGLQCGTIGTSKFTPDEFDHLTPDGSPSLVLITPNLDLKTVKQRAGGFKYWSFDEGYEIASLFTNQFDSPDQRVQSENEKS